MAEMVQRMKGGRMRANTNKYDIEMGKLLKRKREQLGLSQLFVARKLGCNQPVFVSLMENAYSRLPARRINIVAKTLDLNPYRLARLLAKAYKQEVMECVK